MSTLKAQLSVAQARELLRSHYGVVSDLVMLSGGEASQAFAFSAEGRALVLRVNHHTDYAADMWAWERMRDLDIPVPEALASGKVGQHFWSITTHVTGKILAAYPSATVQALVPELVAILRRIHATPVADTAGYGFAAATGAPRYPSWREFLDAYDLLSDLIDWPRVLAHANPEMRQIIEACWEQGRALLGYCSDDRVLNHGDYSVANILAEDGRITGVVDWGGCLYGDPLRDVAWVEFWSPDLGFSAAYLAAGPPLANATERLTCYQLFIAARSLGFFLHTQQPEKATMIMGRVERVVGSP